MSPRPLARTVVALALLGLGLFAASRVRLGPSAAPAGRSLSVRLQLPTPTDADDVARRWVVPLEASVRGLGGVEGIDGQVAADSAALTVRLAPDVEALAKLARLQAELVTLRRRLPDGGSLVASAAGGDGADDRVAVLSVTGGEAERRLLEIAERLEALPGIAEVQAYGAPLEQARVQLRDGVRVEAADAVVAAIRSRLGRRYLGEHERAGTRVPVVGDDRWPALLQRLPVVLGSRVVPLATLAEVETGTSAPVTSFRFDGRPGPALVVRREPTAALLRVDEAVGRLADELSRRPEHLQVRALEQTAEPLRRLIRTVLVGLSVALALGALLGLSSAGRGGAAFVPGSLLLGVAVALNAIVLADLPLHERTLPAALLGVVAATPLLAARVRGVPAPGVGPVVGLLACVATVPVALALASAVLGPALAEPVAAHAVAAAGAVVGVLILPAPTRRRRPASRRLGRWLRPALRDPLLLVLVSATLAHASLSVFGSALDPRARAAATRSGRFVARLTLPAGATHAETVRAVAAAERELRRVAGVGRHWAVVGEGWATLRIGVHDRRRTPSQLARIETELRYRLAGGAASAWVSGEAAATLGRLDLEGRRGRQAFTDAAATSYTYVLRAERLAELRLARESIARALRRGSSRFLNLRTEWGRPTRELELAPGGPVSAGRLAADAASLRARAGRVVRLRLLGRPDRELLVLGPGEDPGDEAAPGRTELLDAPLATASAAFVPSLVHRLRSRLQPPAVPREDGRFVEQGTVAIFLRSEDLRVAEREAFDRRLSLLRLPAGVQVERPSLQPRRFTPGTWRLLGLAALLPALWLAVAAFRLDSIPAGLVALAPSLLALAAVAPVLAHRGLGVDALAVFALGTVLAGSLPPTLELVAEARERARRGRVGPAVYRSLRRHAPTVAVSTALGALLLLASTSGLDALRDPWAGSLRLAALALLATGAGTLVTVPALVLGGLVLARRDAAAERRLRQPPEWRRGAGPPHLAVRSLTKTYRGGFTALAGVSFELEPGVVGLLGPNGAGKTTLMRVLTGLLEPTRGEVHYRGRRVLPRNLAAYRVGVGFLPQEFNAYPGLTGREFLEYWGRERGLHEKGSRRERVDALLRTVGLAADADRKVRDYSGGMRQRVGIALALLTEPPLLIVDEPTTGLDVESRGAFREVLLRIAGERIVILSTHLASDVEATATRLLVLDGGRLRFDGPPSDLIARARGRVFEAVVADREHAAFSHRHRVTARVRVREGLRLRAITAPGEEPLGRVVAPSLEEAYLAEVGLAGERAAAGAGSRRFAFLSDWRRQDGLTLD